MSNLYYSDWIYGIVFGLLWWLIPVGLIIWAIAHFARRRNLGKVYNPNENPLWYLNPFLNQKDVLSQGLILVSYVYLLGVINLINRQLPTPLEWQLILIGWSILGILYALVLQNVFLHLVGIVVLFVGVSWQLGDWAYDAKTSMAWVVPYLLWWIVGVYASGTLWLQRKPWQRFYITQQVLSVAAAIVLVFALSTRLGIEALNASARTGVGVATALPLIVSLIMLGGVAIGVLMSGYAKKTLHLYELGVCAVLVLIGVVLISSGGMQTYYDTRGSDYYSYSLFSSDTLTMGGFFWSVVFNIGALLLPVGIMVSGVYRQERWRINVGILAIFVICFVKYFDWFFTFLDRSMFFILAGALLLGLGYFLERLRRYVVETQLRK